MEEVSTTNPKCQPLWACSCAHVQKTIPMAPIYSFTKQLVCIFIVSRKVDLKFLITSFPHVPYKLLPPNFKCPLFFILFMGLCEPQELFFELSFCAFTCLSNNSLISQTCISISPVYHTIFCRKHLNVFVKGCYTTE